MNLDFIRDTGNSFTSNFRLRRFTGNIKTGLRVILDLIGLLGTLETGLQATLDFTGLLGT